jgi:tRNA(fMet)-specific endonuclease VapC
MSSRFMLDTDTVSFAIRGQGRVRERIVQHQPTALCISAITLAELRYGADLVGSHKLHESIDHFISDLQVVAFNENCSGYYGVIASELKKRGSPIGDFDVLIAAHAISIDATLVTNNVKHFSRVHGLRVENWF